MDGRRERLVFKMPSLVLMIGPPGAGKSTHVAQAFSRKDWTVLSLDALGKRSRQFQKFYQALQADQDVIIDDTNVTRDIRSRFVQPAKDKGYSVRAVWIDTPFAECVKRNEGRKVKKRVPDVAIKSKFKDFERPTIDEGFDDIVCVRPEAI